MINCFSFLPRSLPSSFQADSNEKNIDIYIHPRNFVLHALFVQLNMRITAPIHTERERETRSRR